MFSESQPARIDPVHAVLAYQFDSVLPTHAICKTECIWIGGFREDGGKLFVQ